MNRTSTSSCRHVKFFVDVCKPVLGFENGLEIIFREEVVFQTHVNTRRSVTWITKHFPMANSTLDALVNIFLQMV